MTQSVNDLPKVQPCHLGGGGQAHSFAPILNDAI